MFWLPLPHDDHKPHSAGNSNKTINLSFPCCFLSDMAIPPLLLAGEKQDFGLLSLVIAVSTVNSAKTIAAVPG